MLRPLVFAFAIVTAGIATSALASDGAPSHSVSVILLGTKGGPTADPDRSEPANLMLVDGRTYLIDAGAGVSRQLAAANNPPPSIHTIFLTHHHLDHTAGLAPFIGLNWIGTGTQGKATKVDIYGPPATDDLVSAALNYLSTSQRIFRAGIPDLPNSRDMFLPHVIDHNGVVFDDGVVKVSVVENSHFQHVSNTPDGRRDMALSYRFDTPNGSIVFTGDTGPSDAVTDLAKGADVLVSEVFLVASFNGDTPAGPNSALLKQLTEHMTQEHLAPEEVGKIAKRAGVKTVILTHIVAAPSDHLDEDLVAGVKKYFDGEVIVGHDLMRYDLKARSN